MSIPFAYVYFKGRNYREQAVSNLNSSTVEDNKGSPLTPRLCTKLRFFLSQIFKIFCVCSNEKLFVALRTWAYMDDHGMADIF